MRGWGEKGGKDEGEGSISISGKEVEVASDTGAGEDGAVAIHRRAATAREAHNKMGRRIGIIRQQVRAPVGK